MKKLVYLLTCFGFLPTLAQTVTPTVISNNGGYSTAAQGSIAWTIGEPISETYNSGANITTMGFHQPELGLATLIKQNSNQAELLVYPNPVKESLTVSFKDMENGTYKYDLVDDLGKLIYQSETSINDQNKAIDLNMSKYAAGNYFIRISNSKINKTVKITKVY